MLKYLGYIFFFLMLVVPTDFVSERGIFLGILLCISLISVMKNGLRIYKTIAGITLICVLTSSVFMLWGILNNAPGAFRVGTVVVLWPLLYIFLIGTFYKISFWEPYLKVITIASITVEAIILIIITDAIGISNFGIKNYIYNVEVGIFEGITQFHSANLTTLLFSIPYLLSKILLYEEEKFISIYWKFAEIIALLGGIIILFFSGRAGLWISAILAPFVSIVLMKFTKAQWKSRNVWIKLATLFIVGLIIVNFIYDIDTKLILNFIVDKFDFSTSETYRRKEQFEALISGWTLNPIFGMGHGAAAQDNIGMPYKDQPWAYELFYIALLFQVGIVGMIVYVGSVIWLYIRSIKLIRSNPNSRPLMIPILTGFTSFLIASGTNPYLAKFDYLWVIFLPIAFLNAYLIDRNSVVTIR